MTALAAAVQPLPEPGFFGTIFDGQPWLVSAVILLAGIAAWVVLRNQNQPRRAGAAVLAALAIAAVLNIAARLIVTDRERLSQATLELVRATAKADTAQLGDMLAPDVVTIVSQSLPGVPIPSDGMGKDALLELVSAMLGRQYTLKEYGVLDTQVQITGPAAARTQVRVRATPEFSGMPVLSWWRIDWRKSGEEWKAVLIEPLEIGGVKSLFGG